MYQYPHREGRTLNRSIYSALECVLVGETVSHKPEWLVNDLRFSITSAMLVLH